MEAQSALLEARQLKLRALRSLVAGVAANGSASLAHHLNRERMHTLAQASTVPLDIEMVGESAATRFANLARIALLVDLFESLSAGGA